MKLTNKDEQLKKLLKDSSFSKFHKRLQIILFRPKGMTYKEISELLDCNISTIQRSLAKFKEHGLDILLQEKRGGRHPVYLSFEEETAFLKDQLERALTGGYVTIATLYQAYQKLVGQTTTRVGFYSLLARHGWRKVTPRPEHPKKADANMILASKNKIYIQEDKKAL
ncbi:TPA: helix-turn-helix domain-containing protein [Streptococcus suis]|nr:helix-turn-helix domain-containing protein [Streptococcus suis]